MQERAFDVDSFDLKATFESAQPITFFADFDPDSRELSYVSHGMPVIVRQESADRVVVSGKSAAAAARDFIMRFRIGDSMRDVYSSISKDSFMREAVSANKGLRLTLNDPWETTAMFILSQFNNVKRIRMITKRMTERFGEGIGGSALKAFPSPESLASASIQELNACGMGFRSKYMKSVSEQCSRNVDLRALSRKGYDEVKSALMELDGIGDKVADCIALMGYGRMEAFPIDTWVQRTIERVYFNGRKASIKRMHEFADDYWGGMCGYAQLYLYHHGRMSGR